VVVDRGLILRIGEHRPLACWRRLPAGANFPESFCPQRRGSWETIEFKSVDANRVEDSYQFLSIRFGSHRRSMTAASFFRRGRWTLGVFVSYSALDVER